MKKLIFIIVVLFLFQVTLYADIVEKNNQRYFKLGDQEYVCNADNRISDESAKDILRRVRRMYESTNADTKQANTQLIEDVWANLHKIYTGDTYDEILFTCLKYKLNVLFDCLQPPEEKNYSSQIRMYGGLVSFRATEPKIHSYSTSRKKSYNDGYKVYLYSLREYLAKSWIDTYVLNNKHGERILIESQSDESGRCNIEFYAMNRRGAWKRSSFEVNRKLSDDELKKQVKNKIEPQMKSLVAKERKGGQLLEKASTTFVTKLSPPLMMYCERVDSDSYIYEYQWDELMMKLPQVVISFKKSLGDVAATNIAGRLTTISLKNAKAEDSKKELISFGKKNNLEFVIPKAKEEEKNNKLF